MSWHVLTQKVHKLIKHDKNQQDSWGQVVLLMGQPEVQGCYPSPPVGPKGLWDCRRKRSDGSPQVKFASVWPSKYQENCGNIYYIYVYWYYILLYYIILY